MDQKAAFFESLLQIRHASQSSFFTQDDIKDKIEILLNGMPPQGVEHSKWYRLKNRYTLVKYQNSNILYSRSKGDEPNKRVVALETSMI